MVRNQHRLSDLAGFTWVQFTASTGQTGRYIAGAAFSYTGVD